METKKGVLPSFLLSFLRALDCMIIIWPCFRPSVRVRGGRHGKRRTLRPRLNFYDVTQICAPAARCLVFYLTIILRATLKMDRFTFYTRGGGGGRRGGGGGQELSRKASLDAYKM